MSTFGRAEGQFGYTKTSGTGIFQIIGSGGAGAFLGYINWEFSGSASGCVVSIFDASSGATGTLLQYFNAESGVVARTGDAIPFTVPYNLVVSSGITVVISGGAANAFRGLVAYNS